MLTIIVLINLVLVLFGLWYLIGYVSKIVFAFNSFDEAFDKLKDYIKKKFALPDPINQNLLLSEYELRELEKLISRYFTNICLTVFGLSNDGLLIVNYSITGIKPEFLENKDVLTKALKMDIHKYILDNRYTDTWNIHIQTLVEGQLTFWLACNNTGFRKINELSVNTLPKPSADSSLKEEI